MFIRHLGVAALAALFAFAAERSQAATFSFAPYAATNGATPLAITAGGLTATFSSPQGAGAFIVTDSPFSTLGSAVLVNDNFSPEELDIGLSGGVSTISFRFATEDFAAATPLSVALFNGATLVSRSLLTGTTAASGFPEGGFAYSGATFTRAVITDAASPGFAIGSVTVPEPASMLLLAPSLAFLAARRRR